MATLVSLEPQALRRLLKGGLRRGLSSSDLDLLLQAEWSFSIHSEQASKLLSALEERGWFRCDGDCWKTHLG